MAASVSLYCVQAGEYSRKATSYTIRRGMETLFAVDRHTPSAGQRSRQKVLYYLVSCRFDLASRGCKLNVRRVNESAVGGKVGECHPPLKGSRTQNS